MPELSDSLVSLPNAKIIKVEIATQSLKIRFSSSADYRVFTTMYKKHSVLSNPCLCVCVCVWQ